MRISAIAVALLFPALAFAQATQPVAFQIGAWQVPVEDIAKWQARGVNTFVGAVDYGGRMSKAEWERRVGDAVGEFVTYPGDAVSLEAMQSQPRRLPPDGRARPVEPRRQARLHHPRDPQRATSGRSSTGLPMYLTAGAMDNQWYDGFPKVGKTDGSKYGHRAASGGWFAYCDYAGFDFYLYTWGRPESVGFPVIERCLDRANDWSSGKPIYLFIETCTQGKPTTMTADQWESQVMHAANYCKAKGYKLAAVIYFSHVVFPNWKGVRRDDARSGRSDAGGERASAADVRKHASAIHLAHHATHLPAHPRPRRQAHRRPRHGAGAYCGTRCEGGGPPGEVDAGGAGVRRADDAAVAVIRTKGRCRSCP
jgi:hypothetical protein